MFLYVVVKTQVDVDEQALSILDTNTGSTTTFHAKDFVVLTSRVTDEEFHGQIREITESEVHFVLICGTPARVTLAALQRGRCALAHQPPPLPLGDEDERSRTLYDERTILDTKQMRLEARLSMTLFVVER